MKNKKLVIALSVFTSVLLIAVVSLVAVLAAFQAQATGGFTVSYTAVNVDASITTYYNNYNPSTKAYTGWQGYIKKDFKGDGDTEVKGKLDIPNSEFTLYYKVNDENTSRTAAPFYLMFLIMNNDAILTNKISINCEAWSGTDESNKLGLPTNLTLQYKLFVNIGALGKNFNTEIDTSLDDTSWTTLTNSNLQVCNDLQIEGKGKYCYVLFRAYPTNLNESVLSSRINIDFTLSVVG